MESSTIVVGQTLSDRFAAAQMDAVVGPLVTVTPVPVRVDAGTTGRALVRELGALQRAGAEYRHVPLGRVRQILRRPTERPVFPAMFVVHVEAEDREDGRGLWGAPTVVGVQVEHALALNVEVRKGGGVAFDLWGDSSVVYVWCGGLVALMLTCALVLLRNCG